MLGALILFLQSSLYWYCWRLNKNLSFLKNNSIGITRRKFVWCSIINFIVLVPILLIPIYLLGLSTQAEKALGEEGFTVLGIFISAIITSLFIVYQYSKYKGCFIKDQSLEQFIAKGKGTIFSAKTALSFPNSFIETHSFIDFVKVYGPTVGIAAHTNKLTGKDFHTIDIKDSCGKTVSIRFHASLGELSAEELKKRKYELYVGKRAIDHRWYLYDENFQDNKWEDVDLGL